MTVRKQNGVPNLAYINWT